MAGTVEVVVGVIGRPHGVRGEVVVELRTDEPERRFAPGSELRSAPGSELRSAPGSELRSGDGAAVLTVAGSRLHSGRWLVRFQGLTDRSAVEGLRGTPLVADVAADERPPGAEEYYDRQLLGLRVLDAENADVGQVAAVLHLPGQDLLEVQTSDGLRLVPFVRTLVPEVDLAAGSVRLADVPGLLRDLDEDPE